MYGYLRFRKYGMDRHIGKMLRSGREKAIKEGQTKIIAMTLTSWHNCLWEVQSTVPNLAIRSPICFPAFLHSGSNFMHGGHHGAKKSIKYRFPSFITFGKSSGVSAQTFDVELSLAKTAISCAVNRPVKTKIKVVAALWHNCTDVPT